jgi:hypothetical protein
MLSCKICKVLRGNDIYRMSATTHPDEAAPVCPSLRLRRIEGRKRKK